MKKLIIILLAMALLSGCAVSKQAVIEDYQTLQVAQGKVFCCCNTSNGVCCGYVYFCPGYIPGCLCY